MSIGHLRAGLKLKTAKREAGSVAENGGCGLGRVGCCARKGVCGKSRRRKASAENGHVSVGPALGPGLGPRPRVHREHF